MQPHKVISAFRDCGRLVEPPGEYVPTSQAQADRLVKAGCLKRPAVAQQVTEALESKVDQHAPEPVALDEESTPVAGDAPTAPTHGKKGRNKR